MNKNIKVSSSAMQYGDARFLFFEINYPLGNSQSAPSFHRHNAYEIHFVLDLPKRYDVDNKNIVVSRNQFIIFPPEKLHKSYSDNSHFLVLTLSLQKISGKAGFYKYFKNALDKNAGKAIDAGDKLLKLSCDFSRAISYKGIGGFCAAKALLGQIIFELFECTDRFEGTDVLMTDTSDGNFEDNISVMVDNLVNAANFDISEIAESIGYSVRHTSRLIQKLYGKSLTEVRKQRLDYNEKNNKE